MEVTDKCNRLQYHVRLNSVTVVAVREYVVLPRTRLSGCAHAHDNVALLLQMCFAIYQVVVLVRTCASVENMRS